MVSFEPLNGRFNGKIIFNKKGFYFGGKFYDFKEIQDITIIISNYYKQKSSTTTADTAYSNGVDNKLSLRQEGLYYYACFQISSKEHMSEFIEYLKSITDDVKINIYYQDRPIRIKEFDPKLFGLI